MLRRVVRSRWTISYAPDNVLTADAASVLRDDLTWRHSYCEFMFRQRGPDHLTYNPRYATAYYAHWIVIRHVVCYAGYPLD
jgi:hypothetical protein